MTDQQLQPEQQDAPPPTAAEQPAPVIKEYRCMCGLISIRVGVIVIGILEILLLCHSLIYSSINYAGGGARYLESNPVFAAVIRYAYLLPFLILQVLWVFSNFLLLIGAKTMYPPFLLPHMLIQVVFIISGIVMAVACIINTANAVYINVGLVIFLTVFLAFIMVEMYFIVVIWNCYRGLKERRSAVAAQKAWLSVTDDDEFVTKLYALKKKPITPITTEEAERQDQQKVDLEKVDESKKS